MSGLGMRLFSSIEFADMRGFLGGLFFLVVGSSLRAETLPSEWIRQTDAVAPPKSQIREFLKAGRKELAEDPQGAAKARYRLETILKQWEESPPISPTGKIDASIHGAGARENMREDFFSQAHFFWLLLELERGNQLPASLLEASYPLAVASLHPMERGPNNRSYHFALAQAAAAKLYPQAPETKRWKAYAQAVWQDFAEPGDTYEPGYVEHNMLPLLELATILEKEKDLVAPHLKAFFVRVRKNVSPSGLVIDPGDGDDQEGYPEWLARYAALSRDGTFLWAAEKAMEAGNYGGYRDKYHRRPAPAQAHAAKQKVLGALYEQGLKPEVPADGSGVVSIFPKTYPIPDRLILNPSRGSGHPFAAFYLNDTAEALHHANEDNRGELYHYEVDGVLYLKRSSWQKWAAQTNTFVVSDPTLDFPWHATPGLKEGHWYRGSANIRSIRMNQPTAQWQLDPQESDASPHLHLRLHDKKENLGYRWDNPRGLFGEHDQVPLQELTLSFNTFPAPQAGGWSEKPSFPASIGWYRDYRKVAPSAEPTVVRLRDLQLAGPTGTKKLASFDQLPNNLRVVFYPAGTKGSKATDGEVIPPGRWGDFLKVVEDDDGKSTCVEVTCPPGRLDLVLTDLDLNIDVTKEYPRLEVDYAYQQGAEKLLRAPIAVFLNGLRFRSLYLDHQQGGVLKKAEAESRGQDSYGIMQYAGVYTADSDWTRQAVLTAEGYLIVVDTFLPGPRANGLVAGPVWQLPMRAKAWEHGFSTPVDFPARQNLLINLAGPEGTELGQQRQAKMWKLVEHAVFARAELKAGQKARFVSVMRPFLSDLPERQLPQLVQIQPFHKEQEDVAVTITGREANLNVSLNADGWQIERTPKATP